MGVWGKQSFPQVREKRSKALPAASLEASRENCSDDEREEASLLADQREVAREATEEEQSSPGRLL